MTGKSASGPEPRTLEALRRLCPNTAEQGAGNEHQDYADNEHNKHPLSERPLSSCIGRDELRRSTLAIMRRRTYSMAVLTADSHFSIVFQAECALVKNGWAAAPQMHFPGAG